MFSYRKQRCMACEVNWPARYSPIAKKKQKKHEFCDCVIQICDSLFHCQCDSYETTKRSATERHFVVFFFNLICGGNRPAEFLLKHFADVIETLLRNISVFRVKFPLDFTKCFISCFYGDSLFLLGSHPFPLFHFHPHISLFIRDNSHCSEWAKTKTKAKVPLETVKFKSFFVSCSPSHFFDQIYSHWPMLKVILDSEKRITILVNVTFRLADPSGC